VRDWDVIVVGAGAAGLLAAERAGRRGLRTAVFDRNREPGVKILMSGGTRCNVTHATDARGIADAFPKYQGAFLRSSLAAFPPAAMIGLVEAEGVATKVERGGKVFPVSDRAADIVRALVNRLDRSGATLILGETVLDCVRADGRFEVRTSDACHHAARLVLTTGGCSYPGSGTRGDGYGWAARFGHTLVPARPALTPITTDEAWVRDLRGVTLDDAAIRLVDPERNRPLAARRGPLLFAHFGLSGPAILDMSREVSGQSDPRRLCLVVDFVPDLSEDDLRVRLDDAARTDGGRRAAAWIADHLPRRLAESLAARAGIGPHARLAELPRGPRRTAIDRLKRLEIPVSGTLGFRKAEVTAGGVCLNEVDSRTMESRRVPGLFFAGEILDLDGPIGGYNFQAAFSTGWAAGSRIGSQDE